MRINTYKNSSHDLIQRQNSDLLKKLYVGPQLEVYKIYKLRPSKLFLVAAARNFTRHFFALTSPGGRACVLKFPLTRKHEIAELCAREVYRTTLTSQKQNDNFSFDNFNSGARKQSLMCVPLIYLISRAILSA